MQTRIVKQLNTEKTHSLEGQGIYAFMFSACARKADIKKLVEKTFSVKVDEVRTLNTFRKIKSFRGITGSQPTYKKVYIRVAKGMRITTNEDVKA